MTLRATEEKDSGEIVMTDQVWVSQVLPMFELVECGRILELWKHTDWIHTGCVALSK